MEPIKIFYSYSHKDERFRETLETHLKLLSRHETAIFWHDRKITAGAEWKKQIDDELRSANIILLLISSDFLASDYCYEKEMEVALQLHESKQSIVIPIILRPSDWADAPFSKLQALPKDALAITLWDNEDQAWLNVVSGIKASIAEINSLKTRKGEKSEFHNINDLLKSEILTIDQAFRSLVSDSPSVRGIKSGFKQFDSCLDGILPSELVAISSRSELLRSSFSLQIANHIAINEKKAVGYFSFNCSADRLIRKLLASESKIPERIMAKALLDECHWPSLSAAVGRIKDSQLFIDDNISLDLDHIKLKVKQLIEEENVELVVIDGLDTLSFNEREKSHENHPEVVVKKLSVMAKTLGVSILVATNVDRKVDLRLVKTPLLQDLHCVGFLDEVADKVIFLNFHETYAPLEADRPRDQEAIEVTIAKNSFVNTEIGTFSLTFYSNLFRFENLTD